MAEPVLVYFDSCVFIELLQRDDKDRTEACDYLMGLAEKKELVIVTSTVAITEVNKLPESSALPEEQSKKILAAFQRSYFKPRPVTRAVAELAHELTRTHGLKNLDAIHVATALLSRVSVLYTYDGPKQRRRGILRHHLSIGSPPLRIEMPPAPPVEPLYKGTGDYGETPPTSDE